LTGEAVSTAAEERVVEVLARSSVETRRRVARTDVNFTRTTCHVGRQTDRQIGTRTETHTDMQTHRQTQRHTQRHTGSFLRNVIQETYYFCTNCLSVSSMAYIPQQNSHDVACVADCSFSSNLTLHRHLAPLRTHFMDIRTALRLFLCFSFFLVSVIVISFFSLSISGLFSLP